MCFESTNDYNTVTPYVGVWIETLPSNEQETHIQVTPYVGVWIETDALKGAMRWIESHPTWVCGLKPGSCLLL